MWNDKGFGNFESETNEAHCPQSCFGSGVWTLFTQHLLDHAQEDLQHGGDGTRIALKEITQPLRQR